MKLTIAFDDISLPLPKMRRPDIRQRVIEAVLDLAADGRRRRRPPHRRARPAPADDRGRAAPRRRRPGLRRLRPARPAQPARRRGPRQPAFLGTTPEGEEVEINKRAAESDLLVYVNINLVAMDGGWKSTATGLASYRSLRHHHNPDTMQASAASWTSTARELHKSNWRMGKVLADTRRQGLPDRDDDEHRHVPQPVRLPAPSASGSGRPAIAPPTSAPPKSLKRTPTGLARKIFTASRPRTR